MADVVGWYVRVTFSEVDEDGYNSVLYIAGFSTPAEAETAVRKAHNLPNDVYDVLPGEIEPGQGPQPARGEVRLMPGAK